MTAELPAALRVSCSTHPAVVRVPLAPDSGGPTPQASAVHRMQKGGSAMGRLLTFFTLAVLATPVAYGQNGNNNGARVGKAGFLLNVHAYERCPRGEFGGSNRRAIAVQADFT